VYHAVFSDTDTANFMKRMSVSEGQARVNHEYLAWEFKLRNAAKLGLSFRDPKFFTHVIGERGSIGFGGWPVGKEPPTEGRILQKNLTRDRSTAPNGLKFYTAEFTGQRVNQYYLQWLIYNRYAPLYGIVTDPKIKKIVPGGTAREKARKTGNWSCAGLKKAGRGSVFPSARPKRPEWLWRD